MNDRVGRHGELPVPGGLACQPLRGRRRLALLVVLVATAIATAWPAGAGADQASQPSSPAAGQLDAGQYHTCAVRPGGHLICWGYNGDGELGYGNRNNVGDTDTPASVGPLDFGGQAVTAVSAGNNHTCALLADGTVHCWGFNADGQLGYGNTNSVLSAASAGPVNLGTGRSAVAITAGGSHTCAILDTGDVLCWGFGFDGQLGYDSRQNVGDGAAPVPPPPVDLGGQKAVAISGGTQHTCAILAGGTVRCWGFGVKGQLGYGDPNNRGDGVCVANTDPSLPPICDASANTGQPVFLGNGRTAVAISAGGLHTCAILDNGSVLCWGDGANGQLGYGNANNLGDTQQPGVSGQVVDLGPGRTAKAITAGDDHTCAILDDGSVECWGDGANGELGYGGTTNVGDSQTPGSVGPADLGPGRTAAAISAGGTHTCALLDNGSVRCWGSDTYGQLGYCSTSNVGDSSGNTPDTAGPVNLVAGDGGEPCAPASTALPKISGQAIGGQKLSEAHGSWTPAPTGYAYQWERCNRTGAGCGTITGATRQTYTLGTADIGSTIRVRETASDGGATTTAATSEATAVVKAAVVPNPDVARGRGFRACLAMVSAEAKHLKALTHRGSKRKRARARRRLARQLAAGRARCVVRWGRTPGRVTSLRVLARGKTKVELRFVAPGTAGHHPPPAHSYLVKQSLTPIRSARDFARAQTLCKGACTFPVIHVGDRIVLTITSLQRHTKYYYAVAARDNVTARLGPRSRTVKANTA
jgi:alpha-tubulin suppressor-like RCC1 family protein